jgi:aminoglycoside phosphotransferase family enzyme/predicted kinase
MEITTHLSRVIVNERDVLKRKRPVELGFVDFRTTLARKAACDAEVTLNRRLAPDVYYGVVPVVEDGEVVDWAVHMRRLPQEERADDLLAAGALDHAKLDLVATTLADFHASARSDAEVARFGSVESVRFNVEENFEQTENTIGDYLLPNEARELVLWQREILRERAPLIAGRAACGRVRDGHGDLRLEHVYFEAGKARPTIIDCIEFADRFRFADVCADVAFLSMDLAAHGRADLAEHFLARYARAANDFDLYDLVDFYESYRATVRGKVAAILARDPNAPDETRAEAAREARRSFALALAADRRSLLRPSVVAIGGLIASGKSTTAELVARETSAPIVDADRTRKSMLGKAATERIDDAAWSGAYDPVFTESVYEEVLRRADAVIRSGRPVVIDASFRSPAMRASARAIARKHGVPFHFIECRAPRDVCRARLVKRATETHVSDGRVAIFDSFASKWEAPREISPDELVVLDTTRSEIEQLAMLRASIDVWPLGLAG